VLHVFSQTGVILQSFDLSDLSLDNTDLESVSVRSALGVSLSVDLLSLEELSKIATWVLHESKLDNLFSNLLSLLDRLDAT